MARSATQQAVGALQLLGGHLCLDFANTVDHRHSTQPHEYLTDYEDVVAWGRHASVLTAAEAEWLHAEAERRPVAARTAFARALALREAIYRVFAALRQGTSPLASDLAQVQQSYVRAVAHARLVASDAAAVWAWRESERALDCMLWPVAHSAVELLTTSQAQRVKECAGLSGCSWLFLDRSKNGSRRWCSMNGCGSRAKMRRHYARQRTIQTGANRREDREGGSSIGGSRRPDQ